MYRILVVVAVASSFLLGCQSHEKHVHKATDTDNIQRVVADLMEQHRLGLLNKDAAALDRLWADDLTFINLHGQLLTKPDRLENVRTGKTSLKSVDVTEELIRSTGPTSAVSTCRVRIQGDYSGQEGSGDYRCTLVWAQPRGRWQLVAVQMTRIEP